MNKNRVIGTYEQGIKGTLLIVFGGMHGNEPAGVRALEEMFKMLQAEEMKYPDFVFRGKIIGLIGNLAAFQAQERFLKKDMNREFTPENILRIKNAAPHTLDSEDFEIKTLLSLIDEEIAAYNPSKLVFLDLHTTTAFGGIFSIATADKESQRIAMSLHAPVILKMLDGLQGTTMHHFCIDNYGKETVAVTFESGQHNEELSVSRAIAAITNCLRSIGCVDANVVEHRHDQILIDYARGLPRIADLVYCHNIEKGDDFVMKKGYANFQKIKQGEVLADDKNGEIKAKTDGRILMPLYQKQGQDGFFVIKIKEEYGYYQ